MSFKRAFVCGVIAGGSLAIILLLLVRIRPFPVEVNAWIEWLTFKICPFYLLGFTSWIPTASGVVVVTVLGNAVVYGAVGTLLLFVCRLVRRVAQVSAE